MINFRIVPHTLRPNTSVVEVLVDGNVAAVIYQDGEKGIKLVSAHIKETNKDDGFLDRLVIDDGSSSFPPFPAVKIQFDPCPYTIIGNKIVRHK
jgi:hypothetical protein